MKKVILFSLGCLVTATLFAQTYTTVYTPKGTAVSAKIYNEMTAQQIIQTNNMVASLYQNTTRLADASTQYNCHAYAFHLTEGKTNRVWIDSPGDDSYWQDGSFVEVCTEANGRKVSYPSGDHSAVRSAQSIPLGRYDSKWGQWPVLRHAPTDTPYNSSGRKYYVSTAISGPSYICTANSTFSVASISGATYTWTKSSNVILSGSGHSISARAASTTSGSGWVRVTISTGCGTATTTKNVTTNLTPVRMSPTTYPGPYATIYAEIDPVPGAFSYEWYLNGQFQQVSSYNHEFTVDDCGNYTTGVRVRTSACGWSAISTISFTVTCSGNFTVYPNPADEQLTIEQTTSLSGAASATASVNPLPTARWNIASVPESFSVKLLNAQQKEVASGTATNSKIQLDTSTLPAGTYYLHIYYTEGILQKQVVIE